MTYDATLDTLSNLRLFLINLLWSTREILFDKLKTDGRNESRNKARGFTIT